MPKAPVVIHQYGRPYRAKLPNGDIVERQESMYVPTYQAVYPCLDYQSHFVYYTSKQIGSTIMCTCGSAGGVVGYEGYRRFASYQGEKVVACLHYTQYDRHADGSDG